MVDTARVRSALVALLADNTSGNVTPQDVRDLLMSVPLRFDPEGVVDIRDFGGRPDESSSEAISANNNALQSALADAIAGHSCGVRYDGKLRFSEPVIYPKFGNGRPCHWGLKGESPWARLIYSGDRSEPCIHVGQSTDDPSTTFPNNYEGFALQRWLFDVVLINGGVSFFGHGKYTHTRNFEIAGGLNDPELFALKIDGFDGGRVDANVHDCASGGILITGTEGCHACWVDLTSRVNDGVGLKIENSSGIWGYCNAESNLNYNGDFDGMSRCFLQLWFENSFRSSSSRFQARVRESWDNTFIGQTQEGQWDVDLFSWLSNRWLNPAAEQQLDLRWPQQSDGTITLTDRNNNIADPAEVHTSDDLTFEVKAGCFGSVVGGPGQKQLNLKQVSGTGLSGATWSAGDYFVVSFDLSSPDWQYIKTQPWFMFKLEMNHTNLAELITLSTPSRHYVSPPARFTQDGSNLDGSDCVMASLGIGSGGSGPTQAFTFTIANAKIFLLKNAS